MATEGYEVTGVDELTVLRTVSSLPQADGSVIHQNGMGRTYLEGEVVPADMVAEDWKEAIESGEGPLAEHLSKVLKPASGEGDSTARLGLPFEGYDDMDGKEIVAAMKHLPSATINRIKQHEAAKGADARSEVVDYDIGFGESPDERALTDMDELTADVEQDESKDVRRLTTREVPEDGPVQHGEGITGTGEMEKPYGIEKAAEEGDEDAKAAAATKAGKGNIAGARRRGRRERKSGSGSGSGSSGSGSSGSSSESSS